MATMRAAKKDSLKGVVKGDMTPVAMRLLPLGSFSSSGSETNANRSFAFMMQGTKAMPTAISALSRRSRSFSKCEVRVALGSLSGLVLNGARGWAHRGCGAGFIGWVGVGKG